MKTQLEINLTNENITYKSVGHYIIDENFNVYNNKQTLSYSRQSKPLTWFDNQGYKGVKITIDKQVYYVGKHELIYWYNNESDTSIVDFLTEKKSKRFEVDHINGDKTNNANYNLQLISHLENKFKVSVDNPDAFVKTPYICFKKVTNRYKGRVSYSYSYCIHGIQAANMLNVKQSYRTYEEAIEARNLYYSTIHPDIFQEIKLFESKYKEVIETNIKPFLGYTANEIGQFKYRTKFYLRTEVK